MAKVINTKDLTIQIPQKTEEEVANLMQQYEGDNEVPADTSLSKEVAKTDNLMNQTMNTNYKDQENVQTDPDQNPDLDAYDANQAEKAEQAEQVQEPEVPIKKNKNLFETAKDISQVHTIDAQKPSVEEQTPRASLESLNQTVDHASVFDNDQEIDEEAQSESDQTVNFYVEKGMKMVSATAIDLLNFDELDLKRKVEKDLLDKQIFEIALSINEDNRNDLAFENEEVREVATAINNYMHKTKKQVKDSPEIALGISVGLVLWRVGRRGYRSYKDKMEMLVQINQNETMKLEALKIKQAEDLKKQKEEAENKKAE